MGRREGEGVLGVGALGVGLEICMDTLGVCCTDTRN